MNYKLPDIRALEVNGKTVFLRADLDAPMKLKDSGELKITDDTRLVAAIPTIEYLRKNGAKIIIGGHVGRPTEFDKRFSLEPIARWLQRELKIENGELKVVKLGEFAGWQIAENVTVLENLRFFKEEKASDEPFAKKLADLADIYVNDAFAVSHRKNASIVGITKFLPHFAGLRVQKEVEELGSVLQDPKRPFVVIIGGEKIETKLPIVKRMHEIADYVLVGGKLVEEKKKLFVEQHKKLENKTSILLTAELKEDETDITEQSIENFLQVIRIAQTIVWNGPMGIIEKKETAKGTEALAKGIATSSAHSIVGGGNTVGFLKQIGLKDKFSFVSTGGGAMLSFLSMEKLPGLEALIR